MRDPPPSPPRACRLDPDAAGRGLRSRSEGGRQRQVWTSRGTAKARPGPPEGARLQTTLPRALPASRRGGDRRAAPRCPGSSRSPGPKPPRGSGGKRRVRSPSLGSDLWHALLGTSPDLLQTFEAAALVFQPWSVSLRSGAGDQFWTGQQFSLPRTAERWLGCPCPDSCHLACHLSLGSALRRPQLLTG